MLLTKENLSFMHNNKGGMLVIHPETKGDKKLILTITDMDTAYFNRDRMKEVEIAFRSFIPEHFTMIKNIDLMFSFEEMKDSIHIIEHDGKIVIIVSSSLEKFIDKYLYDNMINLFYNSIRRTNGRDISYTDKRTKKVITGKYIQTSLSNFNLVPKTEEQGLICCVNNEESGVKEVLVKEQEETIQDKINRMLDTKKESLEIFDKVLDEYLKRILDSAIEKIAECPYKKTIEVASILDDDLNFKGGKRIDNFDKLYTAITKHNQSLNEYINKHIVKSNKIRISIKRRLPNNQIVCVVDII